MRALGIAVLALAAVACVCANQLCDDALTTCLTGTACCCTPILFCSCCTNGAETCDVPTGICQANASSPSPTVTASPSPTVTASPLPSVTAPPTVTASPLPSVTAPPSPSATAPPSPSATALQSATATARPSDTPAADPCAGVGATFCTVEPGGAVVIGGAVVALPAAGGTLVLRNATTAPLQAPFNGTLIVDGTLVVRLPPTQEGTTRVTVVDAAGGVQFANNGSAADNVLVQFDEPARPCEEVGARPERSANGRQLSVVVTVDTSGCSSGGMAALGWVALAAVPLACCCACVLAAVLGVAYWRCGHTSCLFAATDCDSDNDIVVHSARISSAGGRGRTSSPV